MKDYASSRHKTGFFGVPRSDRGLMNLAYCNTSYPPGKMVKKRFLFFFRISCNL